MTPDADGSPSRAIPVLLLRERSGGADACACPGRRWERQVLARARPTVCQSRIRPTRAISPSAVGGWLDVTPSTRNLGLDERGKLRDRLLPAEIARLECNDPR